MYFDVAPLRPQYISFASQKFITQSSRVTYADVLAALCNDKDAESLAAMKALNQN